ncbi:MAG: helix-turn-helix domain-containing protein [Tannerella sp.]|jgi:AraC-like DNA-binding protein|nr:helix-turn-helix domain-containing protein [Tannerella sp.]
MIYRVFHPAPSLCHIVDHYWYVCTQPGEIPEQQYFYTPLMQALCFTFKQQEECHELLDRTYMLNKPAYLFGQGTCPRIATSNGVDYLGVKFKPLGIAGITGINMEHLSNEIINVDDIWCNELELLWDQMQSMPSLESTINVLEDFLLKKYQSVTVDRRIDSARHAVELITQTKGNIDIKTLQNQTCTSRKTLERAIVHNLGITPKLYARIVRFNAAKNKLDSMLVDENITSIALDFGFYDSSHFISEFKTFSGLTPLGYLKKTEKDFIIKNH